MPPRVFVVGKFQCQKLCYVSLCEVGFLDGGLQIFTSMSSVDLYRPWTFHLVGFVVSG